jgi:hypothetical protein
MSFDPLQLLSEDLGVHQDSNSQSGSSLGSVRVHSFIVFCNPRSMKCDSWASLLVRILASPYLGHKPKARVATVHSLTLSYTRRSMKCDSQASLLACTFASPYLGRKPKAKVMTNILGVETLFLTFSSSPKSTSFICL